jgi:prepilin-type N-terminal cleavage/methylation domain-containing protein/prepilin-type processing-associated H-X9-DG protein
MQIHAPKALDRSRVHCRRHAAGFTLVELLVVIAVIAVLAALAFPALNNMSTRSSQSKAAANFRQLGAVITSYAADNEQKLPGPLYSGQRSGYTISLGQGIGYVLWRYMGIPAPVSNFQAVPLLTVPALKKWRYADGDPYPGAYAVNQSVTMSDGETKQPFGVVGSTSSTLKLFVVPKPSTTWAIWERGGAGDPISGNRRSYLEPIHGSKRTVLFFDGHVEVVPSASPAPTF